MKFLRAQSSVEFLYATGLMLVVFGLVLLLFMLAQSDLDAFMWDSGSHSLCHSASAQISAISAAGNGTTALLTLSVPSSDYAVRVSGVARTVSVISSGKITACRITTTQISNGTGSEFDLYDGMRMTQSGGGVLFG